MNTEQIERAEQLIREEKAQEAYELLLSLAKEDPENGRIAFSLGNVLLMSGLAEQSVICFRQAIRRGYDHAEVYINMASALEQSGRAAKVPGTLKTAAEKTEDARKKRIIEIMLSYYYNFSYSKSIIIVSIIKHFRRLIYSLFCFFTFSVCPFTCSTRSHLYFIQKKVLFCLVIREKRLTLHLLS